LNNPDMAERALFYFRDSEYVLSVAEGKLPDFAEVPNPEEVLLFGETEARERAEERKSKLNALKERIRGSGQPVEENFRSPQELGEWVLADLTAIIDSLYPEGSIPDALTREAELHELFARSRTQLYIGGEKYFDQIDKGTRESKLPLVVLGESGSGKSALLANWALRCREAHPDELVLMHFIGASPASADWAAMLRRIMAELISHFGMETQIPADDQKLSEGFPNFLSMAAAKGRFTLVLDALNQLEDRQGARELLWLPNALPENMRLVLSTLPGPSLDAVIERNWPTLTVQPLELEERKDLTRAFLEQYAKALSPERVERVAADSQSANPLGLRLLLDELRQFGSHERLDERIDSCLGAESIPALFDLVLQRCEQDFETERPGLVREALSLIWAARSGLSEAELLDMLGSEGLPLPQRVWAPLALALENSLFDRGGLLNFFHDFIRQAVEQRYLKNAEEREHVHLRVAEHFASMEGFPVRKLDELPWQLQQAGEWQGLFDLLADLDFFEALYKKDSQEVSVYWAAVEAGSALKRTQAHKDVSKRGLHLLNWLALNFQGAGFLQEALELHEEAARVCRATDNLDGLQGSLGNQALILKAWGRLEEAMDLLKEQERICRQLGNLNGLSYSLGNQANILYRWGRLEEAMALHKEEERICKDLGNLDGRSRSLGNQALILRRWGRLEEAMARHKEEERICRQLGNIEGLQGSLGNQANILSAWGRLEEAMELHKEEERICKDLGNLDSLSNSLGNQALILKAWGRLEEAMDLLKEQERICRQLGNLDSLSNSLGNQALILKAWGRLEEAMALQKEEELICRQLGNLDGLSYSLGNQALILSDWGRLEEAMARHIEEERICKDLGNLDGRSRSLGNQANILYAWGRLEEAMDLLKEQERICKDLGNLDGRSRSLGNQANILYAWGRLEEAMDLLKEVERICRQLGNLDGLQACLGNQANILYAWGRLEEAMELHQEEERICRQLGNLDGLQACLGNQALILSDWGRLEEAMDLLKEVERICKQLGNLDGLQACLGNQANILCGWDRLEEAMALQEEKERLCKQLGNNEGLCICWVNQGAIYGKMGQPEKQIALLEDALALAREHKLHRLAAQIEAILKKKKPDGGAGAVSV
jgi:ATP-dependent transcriptional regulator